MEKLLWCHGEKSDLGLSGVAYMLGDSLWKGEASWDWTNLRKGDYLEKSAWSVKVYFIFVMGEPLDQGMIRLEKSILTSFCDFPKCREFSCLNYGDWYSLLLTIK